VVAEDAPSFGGRSTIARRATSWHRRPRVTPTEMQISLDRLDGTAAEAAIVHAQVGTEQIEQCHRQQGFVRGGAAPRALAVQERPASPTATDTARPASSSSAPSIWRGPPAGGRPGWRPRSARPARPTGRGGGRPRRRPTRSTCGPMRWSPHPARWTRGRSTRRPPVARGSRTVRAWAAPRSRTRPRTRQRQLCPSPRSARCPRGRGRRSPSRMPHRRCPRQARSRGVWAGHGERERPIRLRPLRHGQMRQRPPLEHE
jgi:hypothetical protein